jgi:hypothetical protein
MSARQEPHSVILAYFQGALNIAGASISIAFARSFDLAWRQALTMASGVVLIAVARRYRDVWNARVSSIAFVVAIAPVVPLLWAIQTYESSLGVPFDAFQEHQLSCLTAATLAPPRAAAGLTAIVVFAGSALLQYAHFDPAVRALVPHGAVQGVIASMLFSIVLLAFRVRSRVAAEAAWRSAENVRVMTELTRALMAVRDLANSPIQALTIEVELLRRKHPEAKDLAARIESSMAKLRQLNALVDEHARTADAGAASFDARDVLSSVDKRHRDED